MQKKIFMLTNKNTSFRIGGTRSSIGVASYPAIKRCGKGVFLFVGQIIARVSLCCEARRRSPIETRVILGLFLFSEYSKINRRHTMPIWAAPRTMQDVVDRIENLASITAFLTTTISQVKCDSEFWLNDDGLFGLNNLLYLFEESLRDCSEIISKGGK